MVFAVIRGGRTATRWVRFTWDLNRLPAAPAPLSPPYAVRPVGGREDRAAVWKVIADSLALDPAWNETFSEVRPLLRAHADGVFDAGRGPRRAEASPAPGCLALTHGARIVGVSVFVPDPETDNHLLTGPCVLGEYRNRGLGTCLLDRTLRELRAAGLARVHGLTKLGAGAARFVYPKFGGQRADLEPEPLLLAS